jgi:hypothetical protein
MQWTVYDVDDNMNCHTFYVERNNGYKKKKKLFFGLKVTDTLEKGKRLCSWPALSQLSGIEIKWYTSTDN